MKWRDWFRVEGLDMRWLPKSPVDKVARCDRDRMHVVGPDTPRLQVDNGEGPKRKRGHGKQHEYLCQACALRVYGQRPPSLMKENQEKMF